jgi:hypothetical protein
MRKPSQRADATEPDKELRRAARRYRAAMAAVPVEVQSLIMGTLIAGISKQRILPGETLPMIVRRLCPQLEGLALQHGYTLDMSMAENTNENLRLGKIYYVLRPRPRVVH